jgi:hypothetical protein
MTGSITSIFGEAENFEAGLREEGFTVLLVTEAGAFWSRLTQITLDRLGLASAEEQLERIAVIAIPANTVLISWPSGKTPAPLWGGLAMKAGEMMSLGSGNRVHARTGGSSRWHAIRLPENDLLCYGRALCGANFIVPPGLTLWRPSPATSRRLAGLHRAAINMAKSGSRSLSDIQAAHGLEQEVIYALIGCLCGRPAEEETPAGGRYRNILAQLEDLLAADPVTSLAEICARLGVLRHDNQGERPSHPDCRSIECRTASCASAASTTWVCLPGVTIAFGACSWCIARCGMADWTQQASRRSRDVSGSMNWGALPPAIAHCTANCRQALCAAPRKNRLV